MLEKLEVLEARLPQRSPHYSAVKFARENSEKGYLGELKVDYHLNILAPQTTILQDVTLRNNGQAFQMDNLVLSKYAIYLIEAKNYSNRIIFDTDLNQFMYDNGKVKAGADHPITQVNLQKMKLQNWMQGHHLPDIPIYPFIAIADPRTIVKVQGDHTQVSQVVAHGAQIPLKIMQQEESFPSEKTFQHQKIGHQMLNSSIEFDKNIYEKFPVSPGEILTGIRCVSCNDLNMQRKGKKWLWHCPACGASDPLAAQHSINDYFLLIKPWITNKEAKEFLRIQSRYVMGRILNNIPQLEYIPKTRRWVKKKVY